jgi:hypothetical protein
MWRGILARELHLDLSSPIKQRFQRLTNFGVSMRRALPIAKPYVYNARGFKRINRGKRYDFRIKPFGFLQAVSEAVRTRKKAVQPIAPFERGLNESTKLPWTDYKTGEH